MRGHRRHDGFRRRLSAFEATAPRFCRKLPGQRLLALATYLSFVAEIDSVDAPPSASSARMPLSTTHSTFSGILSLARLSGSSDQMRLDNGAVRPPPHEAEPAAPHLGRNGST